MTAALRFDDYMDDHLLDCDTYDEIEDAREHGGAAETDAAWEPSEDDEARVERYLRAVRYYRAEAHRVEMAAEAERQRIAAWEDRELRESTGALAYLTHQLELFSWATGQKKRTSPNGKLAWRKGRDRVVVDDPEALPPEFRRVKFEADKKAILDYTKAGGEIPEGADIERGADTFVIDTEAPR